MGGILLTVTKEGFRIPERVDSAMISDSIPNASIPMASSNPKDFAKKKRANRLAKLKQYKLDARREQWLSQVKNKGCCKEEFVVSDVTHGPPSVHLENESGHPTEKLEIKPGGKEDNYEDGLLIHHYSDSESSPLNSPTSHISSILGSNDSVTNFTGSSSSSRSSSSGNMSEEDDGGCLDDWEAMADALSATDHKQHEHNLNSGSNSPPPGQHVNGAQSESQSEITNQTVSRTASSKPKPGSGVTVVQKAPVNCWAWRPDDACRPQSLPNLSKQYSFSLNPERHVGSRGSVCGCKNVVPVPTSCPICYEDLDVTDSSFLPCLCGFRLCLFCHKRILEENGRCPGCRKQYENDPVEGEATPDGGGLTFRVARSCSMITRS
ncbi:RING/U-box superfamily protein [Forsythia ovata]|uniref:RING/U-box superfamily protein n=1 Tax=Forsythia ovata TaxID=205694 RepID=A0ABD1TSW5_9LAMI